MLWQCNTCHCLQILITAQLLQLPFSFWGVICFSWFLNGLIIYYSLLLSCLSLFCFCLLVIRPDNPEPSQKKERDLTPGNFILTSTHRLWHLPSHFANPLLPSFHPSVLPWNKVLLCCSGWLQTPRHKCSSCFSFSSIWGSHTTVYPDALLLKVWIMSKYRTHFLYSSIDKHLDHLQSWLLWILLLWMWVCQIYVVYS